MKKDFIGNFWTVEPTLEIPRIVLAHYSDRFPYGKTGPMTRELWILDYARADCGLVRVGSSRKPWLPRKARTAHLYPPGTPYWEDTSEVQGRVHAAYVLFTGDGKAGLRRLLGPSRFFAAIDDPTGRLDVLLYNMALAGNMVGEQGFWRAQALLATLFDMLGGVVPRPDGTFLLSPEDVAAPRSLAEDVRRYFLNHLGEKITVDEVAEHLGISSSNLSHHFAQETGKSVMAGLMELRIEVAKSLLLRGQKMFTIARQTSFCDGFHFSKAFKKHCGLTPSAFRQDFLLKSATRRARSSK